VRRRVLGWLGQAALVAAVLVGAHLWATRDAARGPAPALSGTLLDGRALPLADYRGRPLLVYFWATWCPVCRLDQGAIAAVARDHPVVTVAMQSGDAATVAAHLAAQGLSLPVRVDEDGAVAAAWGVRGVPTAFVVDGDGQIRYVTTGVTTRWGLRLRLWLARA
jgi:peroxiredoxin